MALAAEIGSVAQLAAFPLAGAGAAYRGIPMLDPRRQLPSGGFGLRGSWRAIWADLRAGIVSLWLGQRARLRQLRGRHHLVVAIGDVYCLWMAARAGGPLVFIATAKSEYNEPHRWLERMLIRRHSAAVFTRDQATADALRRAGLPATYAGNPLMDTIGLTGTLVSPDATGPTVTILPGSRTDAYTNLQPLLHLCAAVASRVQANFLCALASSIDVDRAKADVEAAGWQATGDLLKREGATVRLTRAFGDAVQAADVVVGLAGTANEQAAGLGKPVVTFPGPGTQATSQFVRLQKRLLGDALVVVEEGTDAAEVVVRLLSDPNERATRGNIGRQRMGEPGAVAKIAQAILEILRAPSSPTDVAGSPS